MSEKQIPIKPISAEETRLLQMVDDHQEELITLLKDLIAIDSQSFDPEVFSDLSEIYQFSEKYMQDSGAKTTMYKCPHPNTPAGQSQDWLNLIASIGPEDAEKSLQFCGHLDIVPFTEEKWEPGLHPLKAVVRDGRLYGRGSADMKGGVAAQMMAFKLLSESKIPLKGKLQMWFIPDEEINGYYGAQFMAKEHKDAVNCSATIIGEPTGQPPIKSPAIIVGEKGHQWLRLKIYGSAGHGSMPKPKSNAINKANRFISNEKKLKLPKVKPPLNLMDLLKGLFSRFKFGDLIKVATAKGDGKPDPYNEDGLNLGSFFNTTLSFTQFHSGSKVNVIPDVAELEIDIRVLPGIEFQDVYDSLANYCTKLGFRCQLPEGYSNPQAANKKIQKRPVDVEITEIACTHGTFVEPNQPFTQLFSDVYEDVYHVKTVFFFAPGSTDAVHMREEGIENVVVFGPTGSHTHDADEFVELEHLIGACKVYLIAAYRMLCASK